MKREIPVYNISSISQLKQDDFLVSQFASYSKTHQHLHYPHRHNFYHIVLFTEGEGSHSIDFQNFELKAYQIYFMIPGQVHNWNFDGHVDGYVINFSTEFFQSFLLKPDYLNNFSFFSGAVSDAALDIPSEHQQEIENIFEEVLVESTSGRPLSNDYLKVLLLKLFILVSRFSIERNAASPSIYNYTLLRNFQQLIEKNYTKLKLPKEYANLLYITPNHLNALCNHMLGIPAGEVIRNRVLLEAKRLLINLDLTISEIAYRLNFTDNSYFTKFFRKQVGVTPEEFRKKALNNK